MRMVLVACARRILIRCGCSDHYRHRHRHHFDVHFHFDPSNEGIIIMALAMRCWSWCWWSSVALGISRFFSFTGELLSLFMSCHCHGHIARSCGRVNMLYSPVRFCGRTDRCFSGGVAGVWSLACDLQPLLRDTAGRSINIQNHYQRPLYPLRQPEELKSEVCTRLQFPTTMGSSPVPIS